MSDKTPHSGPTRAPDGPAGGKTDTETSSTPTGPQADAQRRARYAEQRELRRLVADWYDVADQLGKRNIERRDEIKRLRAERDRARRWAVELENQIAAVAAVHHPVTERAYVKGEWADMEFCAHCNDDGNGIPWPCETGEAVDVDGGAL